MEATFCSFLKQKKYSAKFQDFDRQVAKHVGSITLYIKWMAEEVGQQRRMIDFGNPGVTMEHRVNGQLRRQSQHHGIKTKTICFHSQMVSWVQNIPTKERRKTLILTTNVFSSTVLWSFCSGVIFNEVKWKALIRMISSILPSALSP